MADLDDFFARKDKKKSKTKPKFITPEELAKTLEETAKREAAASKLVKQEAAAASAIVNAGSCAATEATNAANTATSASVANNETEQDTKAVEPVIEEEWKEFEEEQRKDYTGLKIGQLTVVDDEHGLAEPEEEEEENDGIINTDNNYSKRSGQGPWKKLIPAEEPVGVVTAAPAGVATYVSPGLRNLQMQATRLRSTRNRVAPDITNAEFFPTLNAARPEEQRKKKNEPAFEEVRHGGRLQRVQEPVAAPAAPTNRFQSLDDEADS